ncbi:MAG: hypothetical protein HXK96_01645 [Candidatus Nanogingivalaceae bacterium]|nr:hypothetical protein [Candidatus Nanogingivalaceae bacterium]
MIIFLLYIFFVPTGTKKAINRDSIIPDVKGLTKKEACESISKAGFICKTGDNYDSNEDSQKVDNFYVYRVDGSNDFYAGNNMRAEKGSTIQLNFMETEKQKSEREKREAEYKAKQEKDNADRAEKEKAEKAKKDAEEKKKQQNQPQPQHQTQPQAPQPSEGETLPESVLPEDIVALCERDIENIGFKRANIKVTNHYAMGFPKYTYVIVGELSKKEKTFGHREVVGTVQCQANWNNWSVVAVRVNGVQIK